MTRARWQELKAILAEALDCESEVDRLAFVTVSCRDDLLLKAEIEALLAQDDHAWCDDAFLAGLRGFLLAPSDI